MNDLTEGRVCRSNPEMRATGDELEFSYKGEKNRVFKIHSLRNLSNRHRAQSRIGAICHVSCLVLIGSFLR